MQPKEIQYIRVRQLGGTTNSLHISDLDTEKNKLQSYKIPVYIPVGSHVDLPLNDDVLLSYNQGVLRGFIDSGLISAHVVSDDGIAEVWVSPDGDDDNPGTANAPYKSIQHAIDTLVDQVGVTGDKVVQVMSGTYTENIIINCRSLKINGSGFNAVLDYIGVFDFTEVDITAPKLIPEDPSRPLITIAPFIKEDIEEYIESGGFTFTEEDNLFTYTGPSSDDYTENYPKTFWLGNYWYNANIEINNIISDFDNGDILLFGLGSHLLAGISFRNMVISNLLMYRCEFVDIGSAYIAGGVFSHELVDLTHVGGVAVLGTTIEDSLIISTERRPFTDGIDMKSNTEVKIFGTASNALSRGGDLTFASLIVNNTEDQPQEGRPLRSLTLFDGRSSGAGDYDNPENLVLNNAGGIDVITLSCKDVIHNSTGTLNIRHANIRGSVTLSGGGTMRISGGFIEGDLTVNSPATVELNQVTVKGNISGDGVIIQNGGGYLGDNTATSYTHNALKTT